MTEAPVMAPGGSAKNDVGPGEFVFEVLQHIAHHGVVAVKAHVPPVPVVACKMHLAHEHCTLWWLA